MARSARRAAPAALILIFGLCSVSARADELYQARVIVTGQGAESRTTGFARALETVLVKVSGNPRLIDDPNVNTSLDEASSLVAEFSYRDRMEGIPVHDEQGTRDRPYDLTVSFDVAEIDSLLRALGFEPWPAEQRPTIAALVAIDTGAARYALAADGERGRDQREALLAAAEGLGLELVLPRQADLMRAGFQRENIAIADAASLTAAARGLGAPVAIGGRLAWSKAALGWTGHWRLAHGGPITEWSISGVSFDEAFRDAVGGAAQSLSGNGGPQ